MATTITSSGHTFKAVIVFSPTKILSVDQLAAKIMGVDVGDGWSWDDVALAWNKRFFLLDDIGAEQADTIAAALTSLEDHYPGS